MSPARNTRSDSPHSPKSSYPRKLFYRIHEVSEITGLKPHVLRYWETQFDELSPEKEKNEQRRYRQSDIEVVLKIRSLLYDQKFTIAGARQSIKATGAKQAETAPKPAARRKDLQGIRAELCAIMEQLSA